MSREKGTASFSANFEPQKGAPIDARQLVSLLSDLTAPATWLANDGFPYTFVGMIVSVSSDPTPANNSVYQLQGADYTIIGNWKDIGAGGAAVVEKVLKSVRFPLAFDSAGSFNIGVAAPLNARVTKSIIDVTTAFDGTSESTLTLGDAGDPGRFCETDEVDLSIIGVYGIDAYYNYGSATQLTGTYVQDGATVGAAFIEIFYSIE